MTPTRAKKSTKHVTPEGKVERRAASSGAANSSKKGEASDIIEALQTQVANGLMLYLNCKHYHWQTFGPHFRDLHLMFDEFAHSARKSVDELAERVRMLGDTPVFAPADIEKQASISVSKKSSTMRDMLTEAHDAEMTVIEEMREAVETAEEGDDPGTADLLTTILQVHEKQEWFLRQALMSGDGLENTGRAAGASREAGMSRNHNNHSK